MADPQILLDAFALPPDQALAYLRSKGYRPTVGWTEMLHEEHARAFTVAKVARLDMLATIRGSLDDALAQGLTLEQWQAGLVPQLQKAGWWGLVQDREVTGTSRPVFIGPRRLRTIYDTNLRMAWAAGRWARLQANKANKPFLRYSAVLDRRTRPAHARWHGTILPIDHPWWRTHFPPNDWGCRCAVVAYSAGQLAARGWSPSAAPPPDLGPARPFRRAGSQFPIMVPPGIGPGFGYNVGEAALDALVDRAEAAARVAAAQGGPQAAIATLQEMLASEVLARGLAPHLMARLAALLDELLAAAP